jgi:hypothetical protein
MKPTPFLWLIVSYFLCTSQSFSIPKTKKEFPKKIIVTNEVEPLPRYKLNSQFGVNVISGSALVSGFQFGKLMTKGFPFYLGPEIHFMLFSPGSILNVLFGGWIETPFFSNPKRTLDLGLSFGAGFSNKRSGLSTTNVVAFTDIAYSQKMDENLVIRALIRPGVIGRIFIGSLNFNAQFRFL